ncbi:Nucleotidyl transferase AbiEii toxin, Type IV TA system [Plantibacter sp. VKM Ac-1784]|uniref:Nucleotidyl transferase AbiEii toxin, Type IV TA system n=1 Tax=Plantibacter elymi (nom. nud.) TaxID=199708 RepID=A0ABY1R7Z5_9MICO|nr:nucleotidyl transferase AbiEii/AbiGii toxin family protein [Plantibacter sp. VKM Ac-1784]SMQ60181.1 Nucleotidyl transferase AbiEii toxin, Type IV TA system [Plantibacter sp. VKM Ac-1784]
MAAERTPTPGVLSAAERRRIEDQFGVETAQVVRDHLISHVLAALSETVADEVIFFGGTALARTHLPFLRLSEDIDLIAVGSRAQVGRRIEQAVRGSLQRTFGEVQFLPGFGATRGSEPVVLSVDASSIQVQLLDQVGYPKWPTERLELVQRYSDAPPAWLTVPTRSAFVAAKVSAWADRRAPRDLYDLWALQAHGAFDVEAARLFATIGPGGRPNARTFDAAPDGVEWQRALAHQGRIDVDPETALTTVRDAWSRLS